MPLIGAKPSASPSPVQDRDLVFPDSTLLRQASTMRILIFGALLAALTALAISTLSNSMSALSRCRLSTGKK